MDHHLPSPDSAGKQGGQAADGSNVTTNQPTQNPAATWRPIATVAVCALGGPLLGMALLLVLLAAMSMLSTGQTDAIGMPLIALHPIAWMVAFAIVGVPALLSSIAYVVLDRFLPSRWPRTPTAIIVGAIGISTLLAPVGGFQDAGAKSGVSIIVVGALTAGILAHLTRRWRYKPNAVPPLVG